jgi:hypothetical protein
MCRFPVSAIQLRRHKQPFADQRFFGRAENSVEALFHVPFADQRVESLVHLARQAISHHGGRLLRLRPGGTDKKGAGRSDPEQNDAIGGRLSHSNCGLEFGDSRVQERTIEE